MNLEIQIKVLFYSFIFGMFLEFYLKLINKITFKKLIMKFLLIYSISIILPVLFYYLLYKINYGQINLYVFLSMFIGMRFCHRLYYKA